MRTLNQKSKQLSSKRENSEFSSFSQLFSAHVIPRAGETLNWHHITICLFSVAKKQESIDIFQYTLPKTSCRTTTMCFRERHQDNICSGSREFFSSIFPKTALHCWNNFSGTLNANVTTPPNSMLKDRKNSRSIEFFQFFHQSCPRDSKNVDRTTSLSTCLTNVSKYESNGYEVFSQVPKKNLQSSSKTFLSSKVIRYTSSHFLTTATKKWPLKLVTKHSRSWFFLKNNIRSLKIIIWTHLIHSSEDELISNPTSDKKHSNLIISKLCYWNVLTWTLHANNAEHQSRSVWSNLEKLYGFGDFQSFSCFWNDSLESLIAVGTTVPEKICSKLATLACWKNFRKNLLSLTIILRARRRQNRLHQSNIFCSKSVTVYGFLKSFDSFCRNLQRTRRLMFPKICHSMFGRRTKFLIFFKKVFSYFVIEVT